jgi:acyl transferase domain-containing protein
VVLKPLEQALKDNDVIRSVIVASGINQDGKTPGITMPNGSAQGTSALNIF